LILCNQSINQSIWKVKMCSISNGELIIGLLVCIATLVYCGPKLFYYILLEPYRQTLSNGTYYATRWCLVMCLCFVSHIFMFAIGLREGMIAIDAIAQNYINLINNTLLLVLVYYGLKDSIDAGKMTEEPFLQKNLPLIKLQSINRSTSILKFIANPILVVVYFAEQLNWPAIVYNVMNLIISTLTSHKAIQYLNVILAQLKNVETNFKLAQQSEMLNNGERVRVHMHGEHDAAQQYDLAKVDLKDHSIPLEIRMKALAKQIKALNVVINSIRSFLILNIFLSVSSIRTYFESNWNDCYYDSSAYSYSINSFLTAIGVVGFSMAVFSVPPPPGVTVGKVLFGN